MAKQFVEEIRELGEGETFRSTFFLQAIDRREAAGWARLKLTLRDRTGEIPAVIWKSTKTSPAELKAFEYASGLSAGAFVEVRGKVGTYKDALQLTVDAIREVPPESICREDFASRSARSPAQMDRELDAAVASVQNPQLRRLLEACFGDPQLRAAFCECPAAQGQHHAYLGGLAEHTLEVVKLCETVAGIFSQLDRDLLVTGALLHDLGKTRELSYDVAIDYTDSGRLLGHLVMGEQMVRQRMDSLTDFPEELALKVSHMILSHHGDRKLGFGSAVDVRLAEAAALHYAENLDAQVHKYANAAEKTRKAGKRWSDQMRTLDDKSIFLGSPPGEPEEREG